MSKRAGTPSERVINEQIGLRIRHRRIELGMTQGQLADRVGVTYQQFHKYERAINRVSGDRLVTIADALGTTTSHLLGTIGETPRTIGSRERAILEISKAFLRLTADEQDAVSALVHRLAAAHDRTVKAA